MANKYLLPLLLFTRLSAMGQTTVLDGYISDGLKNNLALRQKTFSLERSMAALREARGLFLPSVGVEARYTRAGGGRIIDIPIGDLMNPVNGTLNTLLEAAGMQPMFPTDLPNEYIPFLREEEQETKLRVVQPIFQPAILYNYTIKRDLRDLERLSRNMFSRQLVADIKTAYCSYLKTVKIGALLDNTQRLLEENLRVTRSLAENGKAARAAVYRAEAELQIFLQQKAEADKNRTLAASYFNFLLNRPLDGPIEVLPEDPVENTPLPGQEESETLALERREEISQLGEALSIIRGKTRLSQAAFLPSVLAVVDYGFQGEIYRFKPEDDFWMASLVLSWNLFNGFQDKNKIDQTRLEAREAETKAEEVRSQIRLQVREACQNVLVASKSLEAARAAEKSAKKSYEDVDRRYREGMAPQIEYIDARNTRTRAEVNTVVSQYDCLIRAAEYEKVTAGYCLETK